MLHRSIAAAALGLAGSLICLTGCQGPGAAVLSTTPVPKSQPVGAPDSEMAMAKRAVLQAAGEAQVEFWGMNASILCYEDGCNSGYGMTGGGTLTPLDRNPNGRGYRDRQGNYIYYYYYTSRYGYRVPDDKFLVINYVSTNNQYGGGPPGLGINGIWINPSTRFYNQWGAAPAPDVNNIHFYFGPGQLVVFSLGTTARFTIAGYLGNAEFMGGKGGGGANGSK
jgi:hypothetical protein